MIKNFFLRYRFDTIRDAESFEEKVKAKYPELQVAEGTYVTDKNVSTVAQMDGRVAERLLENLNLCAQQCGYGYLLSNKIWKVWNVST